MTIEKQTCACGCGKTFEKTHHSRKFHSNECVKRKGNNKKISRWQTLSAMAKRVIFGDRTISNLRALNPTTSEWRILTKYLGTTASLKKPHLLSKRTK